MSDGTRALFWMLFSALCFSAMAVVYKWLTRFLPTIQMMALRNGTGLLFLLLWGKLCGRRRELPERPGLLVARALLGTGAMLAYFSAVHLLPVADVIVLHKIAPFFVLLLAAWWLQEPITWRQLVAFSLAVTGVVLVFRPGFEMAGWLMGLPLLAALLSAAAHVMVRRLTRTEPAETIVQWFFFLSLFALVPLACIQGMRLPTRVQWVGIGALGLLTAMAQVSMTTAYRYAHAGETALYSYASIPFASVLAWLALGEVPRVMTGIGAVLIIWAAWVNVRKPGAAGGGGAYASVGHRGRIPQSENEGEPYGQ